MRRAIATAALIWMFLSGPCLAADDALVGHWRFDTTDSVVSDLSGHGRAARVSGGKVLLEGGKKVLALDGSQMILVPSRGELNLQAGFSVVLKVKISAQTDYALLVYKSEQYQLRIDGRGEGGAISFFPYAGGQWEPRTHSCPPTLNHWCHLVATWDGRQSVVWIDGVPFLDDRHGSPPPPSDSPLMIVSGGPQGGGIGGAIEYAKIYRRVLSPREILRERWRAPSPGRRPRRPVFSLSKRPISKAGPPATALRLPSAKIAWWSTPGCQTR